MFGGQTPLLTNAVDPTHKILDTLVDNGYTIDTKGLKMEPLDHGSTIMFLKKVHIWTSDASQLEIRGAIFPSLTSPTLNWRGREAKKHWARVRGGRFFS